MEKENVIYFNKPENQKDSVEIENYHENKTSAKKEIKLTGRGNKRIKKVRRKPYFNSRVRKFLIKHSGSLRVMEFSCHPKGIHWRNHALFYSESGCVNCKIELEL